MNNEQLIEKRTEETTVQQHNVADKCRGIVRFMLEAKGSSHRTRPYRLRDLKHLINQKGRYMDRHMKFVVIARRFVVIYSYIERCALLCSPR
jgi:hypothetical protein